MSLNKQTGRIAHSWNELFGSETWPQSWTLFSVNRFICRRVYLSKTDLACLRTANSRWFISYRSSLSNPQVTCVFSVTKYMDLQLLWFRSYIRIHEVYLNNGDNSLSCQIYSRSYKDNIGMRSDWRSYGYFLLIWRGYIYIYIYI